VRLDGDEVTADADDGNAGHSSGTYIPSPYPRRVSLASWVDVQAGRLVARSNWDRYRPRVRIAWAVVCWLVGLTATVAVLAILNADVLVSVVWTVAFQSWVAIMLAAYVRKSEDLMKATIWVGLGLVFLPILLVPVSIAVGE
jgi:hypothetical protein